MSSALLGCKRTVLGGFLHALMPWHQRNLGAEYKRYLGQLREYAVKLYLQGAANNGWSKRRAVRMKCRTQACLMQLKPFWIWRFLHTSLILGNSLLLFLQSGTPSIYSLSFSDSFSINVDNVILHNVLFPFIDSIFLALSNSFGPSSAP